MLLNDVLTANRLTIDDDPALVAELNLLIEAGRIDLQLAGVSKAVTETDEPDPIIKTAIILYTKHMFGFDNPDAERFALAYQALRQTICLTPEYMEVV